MTRLARRRGGGFTLLEVLIALGALALILVVVITIAARSVRAANRARHLSIATELARGKMLDIEEELLKNGFQDTAETMEGDFDDEGHGYIEWEAVIEKVELPEADDLAAGMDKKGEPGAGEPTESPLAGMLSGIGGDETGTGNASMLMSQFGVVKNVLEDAIRKVTLTVTWKVGRREEKIVVVCYFTDPRAVDQALGGMGLKR
jgi:general secretion pathway protein I